MRKKYIIIDACVAAAAYAPKTTRSARLIARSRTLLQGASSDVDPVFLIPNYCIGETFAVFEKYRWGLAWNRHVNAASRLTPQQFKTARSEFHSAIHNGTKLLQVALDRYHVLCLDLIAPVNAAYRIKRNRGGKKKNVNPAGAYDLLSVAMGIWLQKQFGQRDLVIATGDERLTLVARRAKSAKLSAAMKAHLSSVAQNVGLAYGPDIYPEVINLVQAKRAQLEEVFPGWSPGW